MIGDASPGDAAAVLAKMARTRQMRMWRRQECMVVVEKTVGVVR
jgi:hypothetical protein